MHIITKLSLGSGLFILTFGPIAALAQSADQPVAARCEGAAGSGLTLAKYIERHEKRVLAADTDGDGKVSKAEFVAAAKAGKGDPSKRFARMDRNGDGMLDQSEIDAMLTRRFQKMDSNGDGIVSADERAAAPKKSRERAGETSVP